MTRKLLVLLVAGLVLAPAASAKGPHAVLTSGPEAVEAARPWEATIEFNTHGFNGTIDFGGPDAEQWMSCQVRIRVPGFEANYACSVRRPELELLRAELDRLSQSVGHAEARGKPLQLRIAQFLPAKPQDQVLRPRIHDALDGRLAQLRGQVDAAHIGGDSLAGGDY